MSARFYMPVFNKYARISTKTLKILASTFFLKSYLVLEFDIKCMSPTLAVLFNFCVDIIIKITLFTLLHGNRTDALDIVC